MAMAATAVSGTAATIETAAPTAAAVGASAAITAASTISAASAAAERPLEAGTRATADTGRVSRLKFFARGAAAARSAGFTGEKNFVFRRTGCRDLCGFVFELVVVVFVVLI